MKRPLERSFVVAGCLVAAAIVAQSAGRAEPAVSRRGLALLPMAIDRWRGEPGPALDRASVTALGADDLLNRVYTAAGTNPVALYVGYYKSQREGDTIHSPLNCLPGAGWEPIDRRLRTIVVGGAPDGSRSIVVNRLIIRKDLDRELVLYWYQGHGRVVASEYWGRLLLAYDALRLNRTDGALVRLITPVASGTGEEDRADASATRFARALVPLLDAYVPR